MPLPQLSSKLIIGALPYAPGDTMSTPIISPTAFTTAFPLAPEPKPPQNTTLGTPHD